MSKSQVECKLIFFGVSIHCQHTYMSAVEASNRVKSLLLIYVGEVKVECRFIHTEVCVKSIIDCKQKYYF